MQSARGIEGVYNSWLAWKGQVLRRERQSHAMIDRPDLKPQFNELDQITARLGQLALATPSPEKAQAIRRELGELSLKQERLEQELAGKNAEFRASLKEPTLVDVQAALPANAVLIDFAEYEVRLPPQKKLAASPVAAEPSSNPVKPEARPRYEQRLAAFVIKRNGPVQLVDLKSVPEISAAIDSCARSRRVQRSTQSRLAVARASLATAGSTPGWRQAGARFARWLAGQAPVCMLPGKTPGTYLLEEWPIAVIPAPAALSDPVAASAKDRPHENLLVVADVNYDGAPRRHNSYACLKTLPGTGQPRAGDRCKRSPLAASDGTLGELTTIERVYRESFGDAGLASLSKSAATEETLRARRLATLTCTWRHMAFSHRHVFSRRCSKRRRNNPIWTLSFNPGRTWQVTIPACSPAWCWPGPNHPQPDHQDGYLTAEEVMTLDLRGVRLCVLSACETGLGEVAGGEGLLGLQRAFQAAGARTVVASLWQVSDEGTRTMMQRFYQNLWQRKLRPLDALREAQLAMLNDYDADKQQLARCRRTRSLQRHESPEARGRPAAAARAPAHSIGPPLCCRGTGDDASKCDRATSRPTDYEEQVRKIAPRLEFNRIKESRALANVGQAARVQRV